MRHPDDEKILLLAHRELAAGRRMFLQVHLRRCPQCMTRYAEFAQSSAAIAAALRGAEAPPWQAAPLTLESRSVIAMLAAVFMFGGVLCGLIYFAVYSNQKQKISAPVYRARPVSGGCAPNLPGDSCR